MKNWNIIFFLFLFLFVWLIECESVSGQDNKRLSPHDSDGWVDVLNWQEESLTGNKSASGQDDKNNPENDDEGWVDVLDWQDKPLTKDKPASSRDNRKNPFHGSKLKASQGTSSLVTNETAGDRILKLAINALEQKDKMLFISLLDKSCYERVTVMGENFEMTSSSGMASAATLAAALKLAKPTTVDQKIIHYEIIIENELYSFYVIFDDGNEWKLGGL